MSEKIIQLNSTEPAQTEQGAVLANGTGLGDLVIKEYSNGPEHVYEVNEKGIKTHISKDSVLEAYGFDPADSRKNYALRPKDEESSSEGPEEAPSNDNTEWNRELERQRVEDEKVFSGNKRKGNRRVTREATTIGSAEETPVVPQEAATARAGHRRATRGVTTIGVENSAPQDAAPESPQDAPTQAESLGASMLGLGDALKPVMDRLHAGGMSPEQWQAMSIEEQLGLITLTVTNMVTEEQASDAQAAKEAAQKARLDDTAATLYVEAGGSREQWDGLSPDMKQLYIEEFGSTIAEREAQTEADRVKAEQEGVDALTAIAAGMTPLEWGSMSAADRELFLALHNGHSLNAEQWKVLTPEERQNMLGVADPGLAAEQARAKAEDDAVFSIFEQRGGTREQWDGFSDREKQLLAARYMGRAHQEYINGGGDPDEWDSMPIQDRIGYHPTEPVTPEDLQDGGQGRWARIRGKVRRMYQATVMTLTSAEYRRGISKRRKIIAPLVGVAALAAGVGVVMMMRRGEDVTPLISTPGVGGAGATPDPNLLPHIGELAKGQNPWSESVDYASTLGYAAGENQVAFVDAVKDETLRMSNITEPAARHLAVGTKLTMPSPARMAELWQRYGKK